MRVKHQLDTKQKNIHLFRGVFNLFAKLQFTKCKLAINLVKNDPIYIDHVRAKCKPKPKPKPH